MKRGLTLLETLLALCILSAITGMLVGWSTVVTGSAKVAEKAATWEIAAHRTLSVIHEDIVAFNLQRNSRAESDRVVAGSGDLTIRTRSPSGSTLVRYNLDSAGVIRRSVGGATGGEALLTSTAVFTSDFDSDNDALYVSFSCSTTGRSIARRFRVP